MRYLLVFCALFSCGCGWKDEIKKTREEFARQLEETRKVVLTVNKDVTNAIPGGTYNLLIRDLNGDDPAAKKRAQEFLKAMGHFDSDVPIEVSVWFGYDPTSPLKVDAFRAPTLSRTEVERRYQFKSGSLRETGNKLSLPASDQEIRKVIEDNLNAVSTILAANPVESPLYTGPFKTEDQTQVVTTWSSRLFPSWKRPVLGQNPPMPSDLALSTHQKARSELVENLKAALLAQYSRYPTPITTSDLPVPWNTLDDDQFLFVAIREEDWRRHRRDSGLRVQALIHERDNPQRPYHKSSPIDFDLLEFDRSERVPSYPSDGMVVWAVRNMTGRMLDAASLVEVQKVKEILAGWQKEMETRKPR
jgi:hypothetical protein